MERQLITLDWAIKRLLRDKAHFDILEGFLSELLHQEITIIDILESESNKETSWDKSNRVDLLAKDAQERLILIEVQYEKELDFFHRILYGYARLITQYIKQGESYGQIKKVITVSIVYFELGMGEDYVYKGTTQFIGLHKKDILKLTRAQQKLFHLSSIEDIFPENYMIRIGHFDEHQVIEDLFDEWVYFLKTGEIKDSFQAKNIRLAKEKLNILNLDEAERSAYEAYLENLRYERSLVESALFEGMEKGLEAGKETGKLEAARNMLMDGLEIEKIVKYTGLSWETIHELKSSKQK
jgi:predicted transposase/invertase (TIGR01784 family)